MSSIEINRRRFIRNTTVGALAFNIAGVSTLLTPREAAAQGVAYSTLSAIQAQQLEAFAEALVPGSAEAGVAHFVDQQLGETPNECMLMCKFFPAIKPPYVDFYAGGLAALAQVSQGKFQDEFGALSKENQYSLIDALWRGDIEDWQGPPPPLFYMMVRSDGVDVVYGTKEGVESLDIPYMEHILPPEGWSS